MWYQTLNRTQPYLKNYRRWNMWYDYNNPRHMEIKRIRVTLFDHWVRRMCKHEAFTRYFMVAVWAPFVFFLYKQKKKFSPLPPKEESYYEVPQIVANIGRNAYGYETRAGKSFEHIMSVIMGGDLLNHILESDADQYRSDEQQDEDAGLTGDFSEEDILDLHRAPKHEPHLGIVYRHPNQHYLNEAPNDLLSPYMIKGEVFPVGHANHISHNGNHSSHSSHSH